MHSTPTSLVKTGSTLRATLDHNAAHLVALPAEVSTALAQGGRLVGLETDAGGRLGLTSDGALAYRPATDFIGVETAVIVVRERGGEEVRTALSIDVKPGLSDDGWADGEHYMLAQDSDGWNLPETGANHRKVYVSPDGTRTGDGLTPGTAVTPQGLDRILAELRVDPDQNNGPSVASSWHVLFERGQFYDDFGLPEMSGESPLHPFVIGAYGDGDRPLFASDHSLFSHGENAIRNMLVRDIAFGFPDEATAEAAGRRVGGISMIGAGHENIMYENVLVKPIDGPAAIQSRSSQITVYRSSFLDAHWTEPRQNDDWQNIGADRLSGLFVARADGVLILDSLADHNGWQAGYDPTGAYTDYQPPSKFSHNFYIDHGAGNITFAGNISSQAASFGAQIRPSGAVYDNVFFENNAGFNMLGGKFTSEGRFTDNRGMLLDTVVTEPSTKDSREIGAKGWGGSVSGPGVSVDVIVAQDGDAARFTGPTGVRNPLKDSTNDAGVLYDREGITVFNWNDDLEETPYSDDVETMFDTTLAAYAASLGGDVDDLLAMLRARDVDNWSDTPGATEIVDFFRDGFGYGARATTQTRVVSFQPDGRAEGFRWDNRLNWTGDMAPISGDIVLIDGYAVTYGLDTLRLAGLDLGQGGSLRVSQALLDVAALSTGSIGGAVGTVRAGQFLFDGYAADHRLTLEIDGGRIANLGAVSGLVSATATAGQLLLAEEGGVWTLGAGSTLTVVGDDAKVGFDGAGGNATLRLDGGVLRFEIGAEGASVIGEFASGRHGAAPGLRSTLEVASGVLEIDLSEYDPSAGPSITLIDVDRIVGDIASLDVRFIGLAEGYEARLGVNAAAAAIGVTIGGDGPPPPPPPPSGGGVVVPDPVIVEGEAIVDWAPTPIAGAGVGAPPSRPLDWSDAHAPTLAVLAPSRDPAIWQRDASWTHQSDPVFGDWVQLRGGEVVYDGGALGVTALNLGDGGVLRVEGGRLDVAKTISGDGVISVAGDGDLAFSGDKASAGIAITVSSGRLVNMGRIDGPVTAEISGGQMVLGEGDGDFRLYAGSSLTIVGDDAQVGFDGRSGSSRLLLDGGTLRFVADETGVSGIGEFASGRLGDRTPGVTTSFEAQGGVLEIDLSAYDPSNGRTITLLDLDGFSGDVLSAMEVRIVGTPDGWRANFGVNADLAAFGVTLTQGFAPIGGGDGEQTGSAFANLSVNWDAAGSPELSLLSPGAIDAPWSGPSSWVGGAGPDLGDWVQLHGGSVVYDDPDVLGVSALNLGDGGVLRVRDGLLEVATLSGDGAVFVSDGGQFAFGGVKKSDDLTIDIDGGRAINTGRADTPLTATVSDGEFLLAEGEAELDLFAGSSLTIVGDDARVGFDGEAGLARLLLDGGTLHFKADETGVSAIEEFASGRNGAAPGVTSQVDLDGGMISVDLSDYDPRNGLLLPLIDVDVIDRDYLANYTLDIDIAGTPAGYAHRLIADYDNGLLAIELEQTIFF